MKRRTAPATGSVVTPALPSVSVILGKLPQLREFLSATEYEDKTPRTPGYLNLRNRGVAYEVTLYDPDSGTRLPVRGAKLDDVLTAAEAILGVEEAPWEPDSYLMDLLERKTKKKKK